MLPGAVGSIKVRKKLSSVNPGQVRFDEIRVKHRAAERNQAGFGAGKRSEAR